MRRDSLNDSSSMGSSATLNLIRMQNQIRFIVSVLCAFDVIAARRTNLAYVMHQPGLILTS